MCRSLDGGGAEGVMIALADAFARAGLDVTLVILCRGRVEMPRPAVRVVDLAASDVARAAVPFARWLRRARPDAVLSTLVAPNFLAVVASALIARRHRPCVVVREANTLTAALRFQPLSVRIASGLAVKVSYPRADAVVTLSHGAASDLAGVLGGVTERMTTIPNPAITPESSERQREPVAHPWLASAAGAEVPVVIAAGRLVKKKGFDLLLDAFATVCRTKRTRLIILGEGPERPALEARVRTLGVENVVALPGFVVNPHAWFARSDVFVLSSLAEGMPNALLQAMAAGCQVVATDCPSGPREILEDGRWGTLVPPGDSAALAGALIEALGGARGRSAESRQRAAAFDVDRIAERYIALLFRAPKAT